MNCPSCNQPLAPSRSRCPYCGLTLMPPVEGALAHEPREITPPERPRSNPSNRESDKKWRDEVRQRVQKRRRFLGRDEEKEEEESTPSEHVPNVTMNTPEFVETPAAACDTVDSQAPSLMKMESLDLTLHKEDDYTLRSDFSDDRETRRLTPEIAWSLDASPSQTDRPVERPATAFERFKAALLDASLLLGLSAIVLYFAAKAARTAVMNLGNVWMPLILYLVFLGTMYSTYFTGTTGSTPGKVFMGLKVVSSAGRPPTYARAFLRSLLGIAGIVLGLVGLVPILLDPARRALHDQLLRTRVVRR
ncbi:MAG: RDD family protein [Vicinamibacteria bacterium]|nr:RDD family protein [Vicinamibacteria bacterium]